MSKSIAMYLRYYILCFLLVCSCNYEEHPHSSKVDESHSETINKHEGKDQFEKIRNEVAHFRAVVISGDFNKSKNFFERLRSEIGECSSVQCLYCKAELHHNMSVAYYLDRRYDEAMEQIKDAMYYSMESMDQIFMGEFDFWASMDVAASIMFANSDETWIDFRLSILDLIEVYRRTDPKKVFIRNYNDRYITEMLNISSHFLEIKKYSLAKMYLRKSKDLFQKLDIGLKSVLEKKIGELEAEILQKNEKVNTSERSFNGKYVGRLLDSLEYSYNEKRYDDAKEHLRRVKEAFEQLEIGASKGMLELRAAKLEHLLGSTEL